MKKLFVVSVVALAVVFALSASVYAVEGLSAGAKAGLNIANLYGDDKPDDAKMKIGACGGAFVNYEINDMFAVQPELLFSMKGAKSEYEEEELGITVKVKETMSLNYLEIPVLAKVSVPMEGKVKPVLLLGPAVAILLSAKDKIEVEAMGVSAEVEVDIKDGMESIDFGLVFGGGVDVAELGPGNLTVDARYTLGLMDVEDVDISLKNAVISIMVGYSFPL